MPWQSLFCSLHTPEWCAKFVKYIVLLVCMYSFHGLILGARWVAGCLAVIDRRSRALAALAAAQITAAASAARAKMARAIALREEAAAEIQAALDEASVVELFSRISSKDNSAIMHQQILVCPSQRERQRERE